MASIISVYKIHRDPTYRRMRISATKNKHLTIDQKEVRISIPCLVISNKVYKAVIILINNLKDQGILRLLIGQARMSLVKKVGLKGVSIGLSEINLIINLHIKKI